MKTQTVLPLILAALAFAWAASAVEAQGAVRDIVCLVVVQEGSSAEGNSLYLKKMGVDPEALRSFALSKFSFSGKTFKAVAQGQFSYEAGTPELKDRVGALSLYEVRVRLSAPLPPKAQATVSVQFSLKELAPAGGIVQPAVRAMELAAIKAGMKAGTAWIVEMARIAPGVLRATVALAR